jgi:selenocysteine lyase/cysteine desulfurase
MFVKSLIRSSSQSSRALRLALSPKHIRSASAKVEPEIKQKINSDPNASKQEKYQELKKMLNRPLYLDAQATTPVDPRVLDAMLPYMTNMFGNPHSRTHAYGWESEKAVEIAREVIILMI